MKLTVLATIILSVANRQSQSEVLPATMTLKRKAASSEQTKKINVKFFVHGVLRDRAVLKLQFGHSCFSLNNRVFLSRNYRLIVAPRKFDVLKTDMLVLRTAIFQGAIYYQTHG